MLSEYPLGCLIMSPCVGDSLYVYFDLGLGCVNLFKVWNCCIRCSVWVSGHEVHMGFARGVLGTFFLCQLHEFLLPRIVLLEYVVVGLLLVLLTALGLGRRWWLSWSVSIRLTHLEFVYGESVVVGVLLLPALHDKNYKSP